MILSMSYVWPAFVAGVKFVTRRDWQPATAYKYRPGEIHDVWQRSPRVKNGNGQRIGQIRVAKMPYLQLTSRMPKSHYRKEGLEFLDAHPYLIPGHHINFEQWRKDNELLYVLEFEPIFISPVWVEHLANCMAAGRLLPEPEAKR